MSQETPQARNKVPTFDALRYPNFRLFWLAMALCTAGQTLWRGTQNWQVLQLTSSAFVLGLAGFMTTIPSLALTLFAGAVSDRTPKRRILRFSHIAYGCFVALLALLTLFQLITLWKILFLAFLMGITMAFWYPTRQASVPELLPREYVMNGIALNSTGFYMANFFAAASLGWLLTRGGISGSYFTAVGVFALSFIALRWTHWTSENLGQAPQRNIWRELLDAFSYVRSQQVVLSLLAITAAGSIFHSAVFVLMPVFARDILHVGEEGFGYLMAASTLGSLVGTITLASLGDYKAKGLIILVALLVQGVSQALFALSENYYLSLVTQVFNGLSSAVHISALITVIQLASPNELRGRMMGLYFLLLQGLSPIGSLYSGALAQVATAPFATAVGGVVLALVAIGVFLGMPVMRKFN